jgi:CheY-like chemotaxis protein
LRQLGETSALTTEGQVKTVLIVDDEPEVRRVVAIVLSNHGYKTIESAGGPEALLLAALVAAVGVVVTAVAMPEMDGVTLAYRLIEQHPQTRVVFMSGSAELPVSRVEGLNARWAFVAKPFSQRKLIETVSGVLA